MTLALAISGWTFVVFLLVKLWIEMDLRMELEEAIQAAAIEVEHAHAMRDCFERECV